jgi:hypothetical protein
MIAHVVIPKGQKPEQNGDYDEDERNAAEKWQTDRPNEQKCESGHQVKSYGFIRLAVVGVHDSLIYVRLRQITTRWMGSQDLNFD